MSTVSGFLVSQQTTDHVENLSYQYVYDAVSLLACYVSIKIKVQLKLRVSLELSCLELKYCKCKLPI